jgi:hypothetical protein
MIRNSLSWLALSACLVQASVGDWQAWTYTKAPVMATLTRGGIWTASSGGAVFYDTLADKAQTFTNLDGLPSTNLVGIHATSDGTVWSISAQGDLAQLKLNATRWNGIGSYRQSGWNFSPRCITSWNDTILLLGSTSGLSLFSTNQGLALDNISSFGSLRQETVTSILVEKDTIWVGLAHGAAYAVPDWKRIGRAGNLLADPTKWTVFAKTGSPVRSLFRWKPNAPMNADTSFTNIKNTDGSPTISSGYDLYWNDNSWPNYAPSYTIAAGKNLAMCLPGIGVKILRPDSSARTLNEPIGMPDAIAHHVLFRTSDVVSIWAGSSVVDVPTNLASMTNLSSSAGSVGYQLSGYPTFRLSPEGNLIVAPWGYGLLKQNSSGWNSWNVSNSCILTASSDNPAYPAVTAISNPTSSGNWFSYFSSSKALYLGFLNSNTNVVSCNSYSMVGPSVGSLIRDLTAEGDSALWIAMPEGLERYRTQPSLTLDQPFSNLKKINAMLLAGDKLYYAGDFVVGSLSRKNGSWTATASSQNLKNFSTQAYRSTQLDGLGNLWVASDHGVDVLSFQDSSITRLAHIDTSNGLLSNNVYQIAVNKETGLAAIATDLGLNLYQSPFKVQPETIDRNLVNPFPNPFRKLVHSSRKVAFPGIRSTSELFIYASDGALINHQTGKDVVGDQFLWSPKPNLRPGLYFWIITDPSSSNIKGRIIVSD